MASRPDVLIAVSLGFGGVVGGAVPFLSFPVIQRAVLEEFGLDRASLGVVLAAGALSYVAASLLFAFVCRAAEARVSLALLIIGFAGQGFALIAFGALVREIRSPIQYGAVIAAAASVFALTGPVTHLRLLRSVRLRPALCAGVIAGGLAASAVVHPVILDVLTTQVGWRPAVATVFGVAGYANLLLFVFALTAGVTVFRDSAWGVSRGSGDDGRMTGRNVTPLVMFAVGFAFQLAHPILYAIGVDKGEVRARIWLAYVLAGALAAAGSLWLIPKTLEARRRTVAYVLLVVALSAFATWGSVGFGYGLAFLALNTAVATAAGVVLGAGWLIGSVKDGGKRLGRGAWVSDAGGVLGAGLGISAAAIAYGYWFDATGSAVGLLGVAATVGTAVAGYQLWAGRPRRG
jgi:hypothetical protein